MACEYENELGNCKNKAVGNASKQHNGPAEPPCDLNNQELCLQYVRKE